jgi:hypothetical protein
VLVFKPDLEKSWWLKLDRAQQHLAEIQGIVARMTDPDLTHVGVNKQNEGDLWVYTVDAHIEIPRMLRLMIGDFMFDLRSALDHIAAANPPLGKRGYGQFPIFTVDVSVGGSPESAANPELHRGWERTKAKIDPTVFALIESVQPYKMALVEATNPEDDALAVFNTLHNADKHTNLSFVSTGIRDFRTYITTDLDDAVFDGPVMPNDAMLPNGARVFTHEFEMDVQLVGTILVAVSGEPNGSYRPVPGTFVDMYDTVKAILLKVNSAM